MATEEKNTPTIFEERADSGDDLLNEPVAVKKEIDSTADDLERASILTGEKLYDDAKKLYRRVLRSNPLNAQARDALENIFKAEMQDLLSGDVGRKLSERNLEIPAMQVLEKLDKDLNFDFSKNETQIVPHIFSDSNELRKYRERILERALVLAPLDRIDIGVAHLEMGLFDVAQVVFESVVRYEDLKERGMYLLGLALIHGGKPIEATILIEPFARDLTLSESSKVDFLYLMGMAFEKLCDFGKSREFFRRVHMLNPKYRDVAEKMRKT